MGRFGIIAHEIEAHLFPPGAEFPQDESLFRALCEACKRTFAITIESSAGDAHTLRKLDEVQYVAAAFSDIGRPAALQIGKSLYAVESIDRHHPLGGTGLPSVLQSGLTEEPLLQLYPPRFESLFGRPPYGDWFLRLKPPMDDKETLIPIGPSCQISVSLPPALNQTQGDLLSVAVEQADEAMMRLLSEAENTHVYQHLPGIFISTAVLTVCLSIERRLCKFVWQRLRQGLAKHNKLWWKKLLDPRSIGKIEHRAKPVGRRKRTSARNLHEYLTLGEARVLIESNWDPAFATRFSGKHRILGNLAELEEIRNEAAHGRPVTFKEYTRCVDVAERIRQSFAF